MLDENTNMVESESNVININGETRDAENVTSKTKVANSQFVFYRCF